jgi:hypothetical protein
MDTTSSVSEDHSLNDPLHFLTASNLYSNFSTKANRISNFDRATVAADALQTNIVLHLRLLPLFTSFLAHKRLHGSSHEKALYQTPETFTWMSLARRLVEKRPLAFLTRRDSTLLRNGLALQDAVNEWDRNGTAQQDMNSTLSLEEYLSYDEIMLASLVAVSGPSFFINNGNRYNRGIPGPKGTYQDRGVIIGLVGARFERRDRMDCIPRPAAHLQSLATSSAHGPLR